MLGQLLEADVSRNLAHAAEHAEDAAFQRLLSSAARQKLERSLLVQRNQPLALRVALVHLQGARAQQNQRGIPR